MPDRRVVDAWGRVDPAALGARIKSRRLAAGLTQAGLAGEAVSVSYLSRIEQGQRRPNLSVLEAFAERLDCSLSGLLLDDKDLDQSVDGTSGVTGTALSAGDVRVELELELRYAELSLEGGDPTGALERLRSLDGRPGLSDVARWRAGVLSAQCLESAGDLTGAIELLEPLVDAMRPDLERVRAQMVLCRCLRDAGELAPAIVSGEAALSWVEESGLGGSDEAVQLAVTLASAYYDAGDVEYATRLCRRVLERAEELGSPVARASAYWNLSMMESERGNPSVAVALASRALAMYGEGQDSRNLARLRNQLGVMYLRLDPPEVDSAEELLTRAAIDLATSSAGGGSRALNTIGLARVALLRGRLDQASELAHGVLDTLPGAPPAFVADAHVVLGRVAAARSDVEVARRRFQDAVLVLTSIGADRGAAQVWYDLGELFEKIGATADAIDAYRRAAVSTGLRPAPRTDTPQSATRLG
jgi:transcriptional regulator with XRE-family HTH domain/ATP/maltotriose-dependent transcriptional regulator MalT